MHRSRPAVARAHAAPAQNMNSTVFELIAGIENQVAGVIGCFEDFERVQRESVIDIDHVTSQGIRRLGGGRVDRATLAVPRQVERRQAALGAEGDRDEPHPLVAPVDLAEAGALLLVGLEADGQALLAQPVPGLGEAPAGADVDHDEALRKEP